MIEPRIGSVCSGTGALDMAVMEVFGGSMAWHCQYEPPDKKGREDRHQYAARILAHHWPDVPNHGDLTAVDWDQVEPVDIFTAGFPCTDLSYAGRGEGIKEGTRSGLWLTIARAIGALRPRLVVLENVRAIVNRRPGLDIVLADLARLGFDASWTCVRASDEEVGAAHERYRWFLLAWPIDADGPRLEGAGLRGAASERHLTVTDPAHLGHERGGKARNGRPGPTDCCLAAADAECGELQRRGVAGVVDGAEGHAEGPRGQRQRDGHTAGDSCAAAPVGPPRLGDQDELWSGITAQLIAESEGLPDVDWGVYEPAIRRWELVFGRTAPRPTELDADGKHRLSPAFVEWLMGLPAGHVTDVPAAPGMSLAGLRNARLKALGNGVVRQQAAYALRLLLDRIASEVAA